MPVLTISGLWIDDHPRDGPVNMAMDEALLLTAVTPILRIYRWSGPWVSLGCFVPHADAAAAFPGRPLVRRWTGGGIVDHAADWTYSLVVPRGEPLAAHGIANSYLVIHSALAAALQAVGVPAELAVAPHSGRGGVCFESPVFADVVDRHGGKLAGAAQRRTRHGLLHQGSVQGVAVPATLAAALAAALGPASVLASPPPPDVLTLAEALVREKYGSDAWLHRH